MRYTIALTLLLIPSIIFSQRKSDLGFCLGGAYYMGDINPIVPFYSPGIDMGIVYRYNFNIRYALKLEANYMKLGASESGSADIFQFIRNESFSSPVYDFAAQFEFNFLPLKFVARKFGFSPFFSSGVAASIYNVQEKNMSYVFPFAIGARTAIGKNWSIGVQWNFRKMFNDKLDGVENLVARDVTSALHNNDWYSFFNLFVTYKIFNYKDDCPAYEKDL